MTINHFSFRLNVLLSVSFCLFYKRLGRYVLGLGCPTCGEWWVYLCVEICIVLQQFLLLWFNILIFISEPCFTCDTCGRSYRAKRSLWRHRKYECQKEPAFKCLHPKCLYKAKQKGSVIKHMMNVHGKATCLYWCIHDLYQVHLF